MATEIEWKFVVEEMPGPPEGAGVEIVQGYLAPGDPEVRVRIKESKGSLTVKSSAGSADTDGPLRRREFEYEIPVADARVLLDLTPVRVEKRRHLLDGGIELDIYTGELAGLVVAEVEVEAGAPRPACPPGWRWQDVSHDERFTAAWLAQHGFPEDVIRK